jgi:hypothetical protein
MIKLWIKIKRKRKQKLKNNRKMMIKRIRKILTNPAHNSKLKRENKWKKRKKSWDHFLTSLIMENGKGKIEFKKLTKSLSSQVDIPIWKEPWNKEDGFIILTLQVPFLILSLPFRVAKSIMVIYRISNLSTISRKMESSLPKLV